MIHMSFGNHHTLNKNSAFLPPGKKHKNLGKDAIDIENCMKMMSLMIVKFAKDYLTLL